MGKTYAEYIARLRAVLMQQGAPCALKLDEDTGAALDAAGALYGFLIAENDATFDFDCSAWNGDRWDCDETTGQTWSALQTPEFITFPTSKGRRA